MKEKEWMILLVNALISLIITTMLGVYICNMRREIIWNKKLIEMNRISINTNTSFIVDMVGE